MRKRSLALFAVCATLLWAVARYSAPPMPSDDSITKTLTFRMPDCPIDATTVPPTKTEVRFPRRNPLGAPFSITGSIQVTDQNSDTLLLLDEAVDADHTGLNFARTVKDIGHMTGSLAFDHGCTKTDPYGSNNCSWTWDESITAAYEGDLQEPVTSGKLIVDLLVDNTTPLSFTCAVCGAKCTIHIPDKIDRGRWDEIWYLLIQLIRIPIDLTKPPFPN